MRPAARRRISATMSPAAVLSSGGCDIDRGLATDEGDPAVEARVMDFNAFYERVDAETFVATRATSSPWDERLQHGGPPTALIARVIADTYPRADVRIARCLLYT